MLYTATSIAKLGSSLALSYVIIKDPIIHKKVKDVLNKCRNRRRSILGQRKVLLKEKSNENSIDSWINLMHKELRSMQSYSLLAGIIYFHKHFDEANTKLEHKFKLKHKNMKKCFPKSKIDFFDCHMTSYKPHQFKKLIDLDSSLEIL